MPLIPPNFSNSPAPQNKPPWARGSQPNNQQASDAPWRRGVRTGAVNSSNPTTTPLAVQQAQPQQIPIQIQQQQPEQTKTSKLQINLKSVKKPDSSPQPQTQLPQSFENPNQPPSNPIPLKKSIAPSKVIPIPILIQQSTEPVTKPVLRTTIPIQRPVSNDPPVIKTENKVKIVTPQEQVVDTKKMPQSAPPAPPPPPGGPPPPPPPAGGITGKQAKIEVLRKSSRKRPDWGSMMKEIEKGRALNRVKCDDRSKPMLSRLKSRGKFVYESEAKPASKKDALHNRILNEITQGVKLKKVHCDDRSRPNLSGLRVRRQSSVTDPELGGTPSQPLLEAVEELIYFDIDVLRDELQSAKQLLQSEVESKHNLEKRTRDQKCQIIAMEAEIEGLKAKLGIIPEDEVSMLAKSDSKTFKLLRKSGSNLWKSSSSVGLKKSKSGLAKDASLSSVAKQDGPTEEDLAEVNELEEEIVSLKEAVQHAKQQSDEMEAKYKDAMAKLSVTQTNFEDSERQRKSLESLVEVLESQTRGDRPIRPIVQTAERTTQTEEQVIEQNYSRQKSTASEEASESEEEDSSDMGVDENTVQKKKQERELILWENKLKSIKDKQNSSRTERRNLKGLQKQLEAELKDASKAHKKLQKEVDKMAKMLKDVEKELLDEDEEEDAEGGGGETHEEKPEEETDEEEESEEEESESDSDDEESSEEDDEKSAFDERLALYGKRSKRRENVLNVLRKGNYLLRANIDRLKDELEDARISYHDLEHELKAVLDET